MNKVLTFKEIAKVPQIKVPQQCIKQSLLDPSPIDYTAHAIKASLGK